MVLSPEGLLVTSPIPHTCIRWARGKQGFNSLAGSPAEAGSEPRPLSEAQPHVAEVSQALRSKSSQVKLLKCVYQSKLDKHCHCLTVLS